MKVRIDRDREGWRFAAQGLKSDPYATYGDAVRGVASAGHEVDNAGWRHKMLSMNWNHHAIDGYPGWEIERRTLSHRVASVSMRIYTISYRYYDLCLRDDHNGITVSAWTR